MKRYSLTQKLDFLESAVMAASKGVTLKEWRAANGDRPSDGAMYTWSKNLFHKSLPYVTCEDIAARKEGVPPPSSVEERARALLSNRECRECTRMAAAVERRDEIIVSLLAELEEYRKGKQ